MGWGCSSVIEHLTSMREILSSATTLKWKEESNRERKGGKRGGEREGGGSGGGKQPG